MAKNIIVDQITKHSGYFRALVNTAKDYPLMELDERYKKVGQSSVPVYALWGDADVVSLQLGLNALNIARNLPIRLT
jgi:hypothetical protein